jgi:hypothetical protein
MSSSNEAFLAKDYVPMQVASYVPAYIHNVRQLASWLASPNSRENPKVRHWIGFLNTHYVIFQRIAALYPTINTESDRTGKKDNISVATTAEEMLYIANGLYQLKQQGITGYVLECGCFKGYSSCCLSHACRSLGYTLIVADSFEGLPSNTRETGSDTYYQPGDFAGSISEVMNYVNAYGAEDAVEVLKGWYSETLSNWNKPLALLWIDVDLVSSVHDILGPCLPYLKDNGMLFSNEFEERMVHPDGRLVEQNEYCRSFLDHLDQLLRPYQAAHLTNWTALMTFGDGPGSKSYLTLRELLKLNLYTPSAAKTYNRTSEYTKTIVAKAKASIKNIVG